MSPRREPRPVPTWRRRLLLGLWLAGGAVLALRCVQLQAVQAGTWRAVADGQHTVRADVAAPRGAILDRDGVPVSVSREVFRVAVAPREVADRAAVGDLLAEVLGLPAREARALTDPERKWVRARGRYPPQVRERLADVRGVYLERELQRFHPHGGLAGGVIGRVQEGGGVSGAEGAFDTTLSGTPGREIVPRDHTGRPIPGEAFLVESPRPGGDVVLTLDVDLQEIARQALADAVATSGARGGNVIVTDPHTGEILAMVSMRDGRTGGLAGINAPFEPGSTLKPFTVAALLANRVATLTDSVDTGDGTWAHEGRVLHDVGSGGAMTLADALRVSSNVGIAKMAAGLSVRQQYEVLRDLGFGAPTGVQLPGENGGLLRRPDRWTAQSPASLAIGYEIAVTPLQMAMAYGALANGGRLMEPRIVRELRDARGRVLERFEPRVVRRVFQPGVARAVAAVLEDVVEDGTGTAARMTTFRVAGKSGTARAYTVGAGYLPGDYHASFAGFFPADDPQLVVFVTLERPDGAYYGGAVAAPVTRATLEAALAARATHLDRSRLLRALRDPAPAAAPRFAAPRASGTPEPVRFASTRTAPAVRSVRGPLPEQPGRVAVPELAGLPVRAAVGRLHALGLRVVPLGAGSVVGTEPAAGGWVERGDTVRLRARTERSDG